MAAKDTPSIIDEALTTHTEGLLQAASVAKAELVTLEDNANLAKAAIEKSQQLDTEYTDRLNVVQAKEAELITNGQTLATREQAVTQKEADNSATAQALIARETAVTAAEEALKLKQVELGTKLNDADALRQQLSTQIANASPDAQAVEALRQEVIADRKTLAEYATALDTREKGIDEKKTQLLALEQKLIDQTKPQA